MSPEYERAAKALAASLFACGALKRARSADESWATGPCYVALRAALHELRDPTAEVARAGGLAVDGLDADSEFIARAAFTAMIDEVLR